MIRTRSIPLIGFSALALACAAGAGESPSEEASDAPGIASPSGGAQAVNDPGMNDIEVGEGAGGDTMGPDLGTWSLPPDFNPSLKGGWKIVDAPPSDDGSCAGQIVATLRDFKNGDPGFPGNYNDAEVPDPGHPDFQTFGGADAATGILSPTLGDDRKPVFASTQNQVTSADTFADWYQDVGGDTNYTFYMMVALEPANHDDTAGSILSFSSDDFFPLSDISPFTNQDDWPGASKPPGKNFHFTTEIHTSFVYRGGETFKFTGDDDLWVFINGQLVIDLGGLHVPLTETVDLDELGLTAGESYPLELFHAERSIQESNFAIETTLDFSNCGTIVDPVVVR